MNLSLNVLTMDWDNSQKRSPKAFDEFIRTLTENPLAVLRNHFQLFHDMLEYNIVKGETDPEDPEAIGFVKHDCSKLFIEGSNKPFFADTLFANNLVTLGESMKRGSNQNRIYAFNGPHGCGKSTFLDNLLQKLEEFSYSPEGKRYEVIWRIDPAKLGLTQECFVNDENEKRTLKTFEVPCPSHDHPILLIPKEYREEFLREVVFRDSFERIMDKEEFKWVLKDEPCTICSSIYEALLGKLGAHHSVLEMAFVRPYLFNRRLGEGITIFNPGDPLMKKDVRINKKLQEQLDAVLGDSELVRYIFSRYAKTNSGVYSLMDIKGFNKERLLELHNIISEGIHKVDDIEEAVKSLFLVVMNPEDAEVFKGEKSFQDRIFYFKVGYVTSYKTEQAIYRNNFGEGIDSLFLPGIMDCFTKLVIASRLKKSKVLPEWISNPRKYSVFCDSDLFLLKMSICEDEIPDWLDEGDLKRFTKDRRRRTIAELNSEGTKGISGRESIKAFDIFLNRYGRKSRLISISDVVAFFTDVQPELLKKVPSNFLDAIVNLYEYTILQEIKESLYYYNEKQIKKDILNYLFALTCDPGMTEKCPHTGETISVTLHYLEAFEKHFIGANSSASLHHNFRKRALTDYTTKTLTQEMGLEGKGIEETTQFREFFGKYTNRLKEGVLDPYLKSDRFRQALKDYGSKDFEAHDQRVRDDVERLVRNLVTNHGYTEKGAVEIVIYVIDSKITERFAIKKR